MDMRSFFYLLQHQHLLEFVVVTEMAATGFSIEMLLQMLGLIN
jgi:hypothetical protein